MISGHQVQPIFLTLILMMVVVASSVASRTSFGAQTANNVAGLFSKATPVVSRSASITAAPRPDVNPVVVIPSHLSSPFAG